MRGHFYKYGFLYVREQAGVLHLLHLLSQSPCSSAFSVKLVLSCTRPRLRARRLAIACCLLHCMGMRRHCKLVAKLLQSCCSDTAKLVAATLQSCCSATAKLLQRYCKAGCSDTAKLLQYYCKAVADFCSSCLLNHNKLC